MGSDSGGTRPACEFSGKLNARFAFAYSAAFWQFKHTDETTWIHFVAGLRRIAVSLP